MRDSYISFFTEFKISEDQFFEFGLKNVIYIPKDKAAEEWDTLKRKINNNEVVFVRGFGRDAKGTALFKEFYLHLVGNSNIKKDPTNNSEPTKRIRELSGYSKSKSSKHKLIRNYQISHVFERTKNVYAFTAPWNIVYIPKIFDPLTGHEAKGEMVEKFTKLYQSQTYKKFEPLIKEFNEIVTNPAFINSLESSLDSMHKSAIFSEQDLCKLRESIKLEFLPILITG